MVPLSSCFPLPRGVTISHPLGPTDPPTGTKPGFEEDLGPGECTRLLRHLKPLPCRLGRIGDLRQLSPRRDPRSAGGGGSGLLSWRLPAPRAARGTGTETGTGTGSPRLGPRRGGGRCGGRRQSPPRSCPRGGAAPPRTWARPAEEEEKEGRGV